MQGLSKASAVGEVSVNFADYVDATKPSHVSLPIRNSHGDAVLHVSIFFFFFFCPDVKLLEISGKPNQNIE